MEVSPVLTAARSRSETRPGPPTPIPSGPIEITTPPVQTGGFVGPGSYRTGLTADEGQTPLDMTGFSGTTTSPGTTTTHTIDRKRLDLGLQIIDFVLEHAVLLQNLMRHIYRVIRMPIVPHKLMLPATDSLFRTVTAEVPVGDDEAKLRVVIRIFQSSYQPIQATKQTTVEQVCHSITGENLRWETIGNILAMSSLCLIHIHGRDFTRLDPDKRSKQDLVQPFHSITDTLTTLTSVSPVVNELGVALKYNQLLLALYRFGDSSTSPPSYPCLLSQSAGQVLTNQQANTFTPFLWSSHQPFTPPACIKMAPRAVPLLPSTLALCTNGVGDASPQFMRWTRPLPPPSAVHP